MKPSAAMGFVLACAVALAGSACNRATDPGDVIAQVGDAALTVSQLKDEFPPVIGKELSQVAVREYVLRWINDQVLYQEAKARGVEGDAELRKELDRLHRELVINRLLEDTVDKGISVTDEEIRAYYEANKASFILSEDMVRANHLLLHTLKEANEVRRRLKSGETFAQVAGSMPHSDSLANEDWDLGYFTRKDVIPQIANVVFKMGVNSYSYPVKSDFGYHILQVVDKQKSGETKRLETVRDEIKHKLLTKKKQDKYQRFLLQMKSKYKIQTNFRLLDTPEIDSLSSTGE